MLAGGPGAAEGTPLGSVHGDRPFALGAAIRATKGGALVVVSVVADGPCGRAGVRKGDAVVAVEGGRVQSLDELAGQLALFSLRPSISVTFRSARAGREADVLLHRLSSDKRTTSDVAEALRRIASSPGAKKVSADAQGCVSGQVLQAVPGASRTALQEISNSFLQSGNCSNSDNSSWIVAFAPGTAHESAPLARQKSPGKRASKAGGLAPANKGSKSGTSPAKVPSASKVRFSHADAQHIVPDPAPFQSATSPDTARSVASPASPSPHRAKQLARSDEIMKMERGGPTPVQSGGRCPADSPLPEISGGSLLLQNSLSVSPSGSVRSYGEGEGESFSQELQQMHALLFKSGEAISSLKDELLDIKDSKIEARAKCAELQAAHDAMLEQQKLYVELLASADKQVDTAVGAFFLAPSTSVTLPAQRLPVAVKEEGGGRRRRRDFILQGVGEQKVQEQGGRERREQEQGVIHHSRRWRADAGRLGFSV